jgi:hypothetical protein
MKAPEIDMEELEEFKRENFRERLEFIDMYTDWLKRTGNFEWSSQQKVIINRKPSK